MHVSPQMSSTQIFWEELNVLSLEPNPAPAKVEEYLKILINFSQKMSSTGK